MEKDELFCHHFQFLADYCSWELNKWEKRDRISILSLIVKPIKEKKTCGITQIAKDELEELCRE